MNIRHHAYQNFYFYGRLILYSSLLFALFGCKLGDIQPKSTSTINLLVSKNTTENFNGIIINSLTTYEYDTTTNVPKLIAEYSGSTHIEYDYVSSNHILANYLDYDDNVYQSIDYYLDANNNIIRQVFNDTLEYKFKYNPQGYLIQSSYTPELIFEYKDGNLLRKKYSENFSEEFEYSNDLYISPFVAFQFGLPNKNIQKSKFIKFKDQEGNESNITIPYIVVRNSAGLITSEQSKVKDYQSNIEYEYIQISKK